MAQTMYQACSGAHEYSSIRTYSRMPLPAVVRVPLVVVEPLAYLFLRRAREVFVARDVGNGFPALCCW